MIIKSEVMFSVITEGRLETVKAKYVGHEAGIDNLSKNDPSGNNKYLDWMAKAVINQGSSPKHVIEAIRYFHENSVRFQQKDINQYSTLKDLLASIEVAKSKLSKKEIKESGIVKIYEDENVIVLHPKTHAASCKYGANTRWCVTSKNNPDYFRHYSSWGPLFFFIDKRLLPSEPKLPRKSYWKVAAVYNFTYCVGNVINFIQNPSFKGKEGLLKRVNDCFKSGNIGLQFFNVNDTNVSKTTVTKYIPNLDKILNVMSEYIVSEYTKYYDLYEKYIKDIEGYKEKEKLYSQTERAKAEFAGLGKRIPVMSSELIALITKLDPNFDISKLQEIIKGVDWEETGKKRAVEIKPSEKPIKPKGPGQLWYDIELDKKLDDERRKSQRR